MLLNYLLLGEKSKQLEKVITDWWEYLLKDGEKISFEQFMKARYEVPKSEEQDKFFKKNLEIMFHAIDANDDGVISLEEFKGYHLSMGIEDSKCTERVFRVIDLNNDGEIDFEEFSKAAFDFTYNQEDSIYKEFYGPLPSNK